jgi:methylglutaconyl-CoA hydratase
VTLNRPEAGNAYDGALLDRLHEALDDLGARPGLRVVVLRGRGRHFQAGADLRWSREVSAGTPTENVRASERTLQAVRRLDALPVPAVALVQGGCFGGGTGLVAACDVVVAADDAVFAISESRWGLMAGIILPQLVDAMGARHVRRYALTGERFDAAEARRVGLVHEVVPRADLEAAGARVVEALLACGPQATLCTKATTRAVARAPLDAATLQALVAEHAATRQSAEAAEGLAAFRERRAPSWAPGARPD